MCRGRGSRRAGTAAAAFPDDELGGEALDETGLAVLAGLRTRQLTAPQDLAVIGVDDIPAARLSAPALTTVATGMAAFREHLADLVACALRGKPRPPRPTEDVLNVIRRQTT